MKFSGANITGCDKFQVDMVSIKNCVNTYILCIVKGYYYYLSQSSCKFVIKTSSIKDVYTCTGHLRLGLDVSLTGQ